VTARSRRSSSRTRGQPSASRSTRAPCSFIGADPRTAWASDEVLLDDKGFVLTGHELVGRLEGEPPPLPLETSRPGVFAVGDVRSGSVKRVASAVGEGSMAVLLVHQHLSER
jgi:thioredoxin reductase (NADPH)